MNMHLHMLTKINYIRSIIQNCEKKQKRKQSSANTKWGSARPGSQSSRGRGRKISRELKVIAITQKTWDQQGLHEMLSQNKTEMMV